MLKKIFTRKIETAELKQAEKLLDSQKLLFANRLDNRIEGVFKEPKSVNVKTVLDLSGNFEHRCECKNGKDRCVHKLALALHNIKYSQSKVSKKRSPKAPSYSGLKEESLEQLSDLLSVEYDAKVNLYMQNRAPHAPSKWEKIDLLVKIIYRGKEYSGNIGNLRQLNFGKGIGCGVDILEFHPQDRQIIRFLAINSESDGKNVTVEAEAVAEFFHCLSGFDRCFFDGVPIFVHRDTADAVLLYRKLSNEFAFKPAIFADVGTVTLKNANMIMGRAGCWISVALDYWWIPGTIDLLWLRNFLRSGTVRCGDVEARKIIENASASAVRVLESSLPDTPSQKRCLPLYSANYAEDGVFELQLDYSYGNIVLSSGGPGVIGSKRSVWKRDRELEKSLEDELFSIGFTRKSFSGKNIFILESKEASGMFLDLIVPKWLSENRDMFLSAKLSNMISGKLGIEEIKFNLLDIVDIGEFFQIKYSLRTSKLKESLSWKKLLNVIKGDDNYLSVDGELVGRVSEELARFVDDTSSFTEVVKSEDSILQIPRSSALYWGGAYYKLSGSIPKIIEDLQQCMPDIAADLFQESFSNSTRKNDAEELVEEVLEDTTALSPSKSDKQLPDKKYKLSATLRSYQKEGVKWMQTMLHNRFNVILADEMGLGKTVQTLALLLEEKNSSEEMNNTPSLLVCPSSLIDNWQLEAAKFAPQLKTLIVRGSKCQKTINKISDNDLIILSYSIASRILEDLQKRSFYYLILDEAQHIKNPSTVNAKTCKAISAKHRVILTGTPMENSPDELWSLFDFLQPKMLGTIAGFKKRYADINNSSLLQSDLAARTAPFILRRKKLDVEPDLPEKVVQTIYCEMSPGQRKIYDDFREKGLECFDALVKKGNNKRFDLLSNLLRLRQICCHPELLPIDTNGLSLPSAKTELLQELLLEALDSGHKVLLFSQFTSFLTIIKKWLIEKGINFEYLDGGTKDRIQRVQNFNNSDDIPLFLLSLRAGGVGLNLTSADRVIIYDPWWNPAVEAQATDRTHRIGQTKSVYSMKLVVRNSIEEKILKLQEKKQQIFSNLVENKSTSLKQLSNEDLEFLLT